MRNSWIVALIIVVSCSFVNAANSFKDQIQIAILKGEDSSFKSALADHIGIDRNLPYRALEIQDGSGIHDFDVILKNEKPLCVIMTLSHDTATEGRTNFFRASVKGKLQKAFDDFGRFDAEHKPIRGSGVITDRKLTPEVRAAFQHELDFWLKGLYRKPAPAGATPSKSN